MRARSAVVLAAMLAAPVLLASMPGERGHLQAHSGAQLGASIELLLGRIGADPTPEVAPPPAAGGGAPGLAVHWLAGERAWVEWTYQGQPQPIDLDQDGEAELRAEVQGLPSAPTLRLAGLGAAGQPWAAWVQEGDGQWGLAGSGQPPDAMVVGFRAGALRLGAHGASASWHAAFAGAPEHRRALAWLSEGPGGLEAEVGLGFRLASPREPVKAVRAVVVDEGRTHDVTLRDAPAGAKVLRGEDGALRYHAPRAGGALASQGDAAPVGQPGALSFVANPLPPEMVLAPSGPGFGFAASQPTNILLDWRPPDGEGLRVVGNDVDGLVGKPGAGGGIVLEGLRGTVAVQRPASDLAGQAVALGPQNAFAVGGGSLAAPLAAAAMLGGLLAWAGLGTLGRKP